MQKTSLGVSKEGLIKVGGCAGVLAALFLIVYWFGFNRAAALDKEITTLKVKQRQHERLMGPHKKLQDELAELEEYVKNINVGLIELQPLEPDEISSVVSYLDTLAKNVGLETLSIAPDPESMKKHVGQLVVRGQFVGDFHLLDPFLRRLGGKLSALKQIEEIGLVESSGDVVLTLQLQLAVKQSKQGNKS